MMYVVKKKRYVARGNHQKNLPQIESKGEREVFWQRGKDSNSNRGIVRCLLSDN